MPHRNKQPRFTSTTIEKLVFGGQGMGYVSKADGTNPQAWPQQRATAFSWNALPGELVDIQLTRRKKDWAEGVAVTVSNSSPHRIEPREPHYLSCSPWQILSWEQELKWKVEMASETYEKIGKLKLDTPLEITTSDSTIKQYNNETAPTHAPIPTTLRASTDLMFGYRNKMEYSFALAEQDLPPGHPGVPTHRDDRVPEWQPVSLAFFQRGTNQRYPIHDCQLAEPALNQAAHHILDWINEQQIPLRSLKSLILRSNGNGEVIAALFIKDGLDFSRLPSLGVLDDHNSLRPNADGPLAQTRKPANPLIDNNSTGSTSSELKGFTVYYSTHKTPASRPDKLLYSSGQDYLTISIKCSSPQSPPKTSRTDCPVCSTVRLKFGLLSFFQVNLPAFQLALDDIARSIDPGSRVVDFYSGVGAISLPLHDRLSSCTLVDNNAEAIEYAKQNIEQNGLKNYEAILSESEHITDLITPDKTIIFDPPRAGLHADVVEKVLETKPPRIIYLSCNVSTQARDLTLLQDSYEIKFLKLYNFFPRTPHIEALCVLDAKE